MAKWKHFNFEQRKIIKQGLSRDHKLVEISTLLEKDPTSVSKEIKRNRVEMHQLKSRKVYPNCKKTNRYPYVCDGCNLRYSCGNQRFTYDPKKAQSQADSRLVESREGINMTEDEFARLNEIVKEGVEDNFSIYHIVHDNDEIDVSVPTVYRYINEGYLDTKRMDLPYAVRYKKRKRKQYVYTENKAIDRTKRTYMDYLAYIHQHPRINIIQKDFLGSIRTDKKSILVMTIPEIHYVILFLIESPTQEKMIDIYNQLELELGLEDFQKLFPVILTDRDPIFSNYERIEMSIQTGEQRTRIYYCDPMASHQKANVEQMNKQLRRFYPKGHSIDHCTPGEIKETENRINRTRVESLSGFSPDEAFEAIYGLELLKILKSIII